MPTKKEAHTPGGVSSGKGKEFGIQEESRGKAVTRRALGYATLFLGKEAMFPESAAELHVRRGLRNPKKLVVFLRSL